PKRHPGDDWPGEYASLDVYQQRLQEAQHVVVPSVEPADPGVVADRNDRGDGCLRLPARAGVPVLYKTNRNALKDPENDVSGGL
ncbi:MAG: hypothetical protein ABEK50_14980, partial [bacterium]